MVSIAVVAIGATVVSITVSVAVSVMSVTVAVAVVSVAVDSISLSLVELVDSVGSVRGVVVLVRAGSGVMTVVVRGGVAVAISMSVRAESIGVIGVVSGIRSNGDKGGIGISLGLSLVVAVSITVRASVTVVVAVSVSVMAISISTISVVSSISGLSKSDGGKEGKDSNSLNY